MVEEFEDRGRALYLCTECGLGYLDRETATACEAYCASNHACSLEYVRQAVYVGYPQDQTD